MINTEQRKVGLTFLIAAILVSFGLGFSIGKEEGICKSCPPQDMEFSLFWNTYHKLQEKFVDKGKFDNQKLLYGAITGMVKSLDDPYTVFFDPQESKKFMDDVRGTFEGIGAEIGIKKGQLQIIAPLEGSPAQKEGLKRGDKILKIDETITSDLAIDEAVNLIRGKSGTKVTLTLFRDEWEKSREIGITREVITIPSVKWELKNNDIAYLQLFHFSEKANSDFFNAAIEIINSPAKKMILDLRNNPGGYLEVARDIAGWFLEKDQIVTIEDFGNGKEKKEYKADGNAKLSSYPIVILVNNGSASASEILAGALRDNRGVKLVGETSFGKGSVQEVEELKGGASLKVTIAKWLTPNGQLISEKGLEPDVKITISEKEEKEEKDPQLEKALEIIKDL